MNFEIVQAEQSDFDALGHIMFQSVREGTSPYSGAQRRVWMPQPRSGTIWNERLAKQFVLMARGANEGPIGFMSLCENGYVDFAYILSEARGQGLFRSLYDAIESEASRRTLPQISTHASLMAMPAFKAVGFDIVHKETVEMSGEELERYEMIKPLT